MPANTGNQSRDFPQKVRLLVVRLGAMGDILHSMPAVTALRQAHPEWMIGWAIEPQWRGLFCAKNGEMPLVDRVHLVPAKRWAKAPLNPATLGDIRRVRRELRAVQYDIAVDLQGAVRSAMVARWSKAEHVIGEARPREFAAKWLFDERVPTRGVHVIEQSLEVANAILRERLPMTLPLLPHDPVAEAMAAEIQQPFVLLSPGAGWGAKRWPAERYGAVARRLADAGYGVVINSAPAEEHLAREIVETSGGAAQAMTLDLAELMAVTRRAALAIAGDTGPLHLACALNQPVVGIFGPTDPARNGPFHCRSRVLRHPDSVRDHSRRSEPEAGLLTITPEDVTHAALELLGEKR
ncbi:MAG TPA: glycosyltransferase family 9 protein [Acidobacteriaceae bacterium]|nr:glycosyltransferase family 9 protein [Acidobacteriaceae bacterium]